MQMFVKSAHTVTRTHHSVNTICSNIKKHAAYLTIEPSLAIHIAKLYVKHEKSLELSLKPPSEDYRPILKQCCNKDQEVILSTLVKGSILRTIRHSVPLTIEPTMTVGALKSMLKPVSWIPKENLVLVHRRRSTPLDDDNSTLSENGVKNQDTLLACMGGSFSVTIGNFMQDRKFPITVNSCFETIGDVKEKIHQVMPRIPTEKLCLHYRRNRTPIDDNGITLLALGIVKPYLPEIEPCLQLIRLGVWEDPYCYI